MKVSLVYLPFWNCYPWQCREREGSRFLFHQKIFGCRLWKCFPHKANEKIYNLQPWKIISTISPATKHMIASKYNFTDKYFPNIFFASIYCYLCKQNIYDGKILWSKKYEFDCRIDFLCFSLVIVSVIIRKLIDRHILRGWKWRKKKGEKVCT